MTSQRTAPLRIVVPLAATCVALLASSANAQVLRSRGVGPEDPVLQYAEQLAPKNQFFINNNEDVEIIRFKTPHDLELCAGVSRADQRRYPNGFPIMVSWDNQTAVIAPGNCLAFDAMKVRVRAASHLPQDIELTGTFRVIK